MSAILLIKGPVCNKKCIAQNGPLAVRHIVKSQFLNAANALVAANLGRLIKLPCSSTGNRRSEVFVKKLPAEISNCLAGNEDLCTLDKYTARFYMPAPGCVGQPLRDELVQGGFVKAEHFINPLDYKLMTSSARKIFL